VIVHETSTLTLDRARSFARAGHPSLPVIARASPAEATFWVLPPLGRSLEDGATIGRKQIARLREAIAKLHEASGVHGAIDHAHVYIHDGVPSLAFPRRIEPGARPEGDLADLEKIAALVLD
jgi:eukaryotic-like serine/threonine-protein kinase